MPVVENGKLLGMVSEHDCLNAILKGTYQGEVGGRVREVMTHEVDTLALDSDVVEAAEHFMKQGAVVCRWWTRRDGCPSDQPLRCTTSRSGV